MCAGGCIACFETLGLLHGTQVVCDDGKNEKMVMKNAHEIAILSSLSHPNIVQAYNCLTDVLVRDVLAHSTKISDAKVLGSPAFKYLQQREDKTCHIEIIEYCDLGSLASALSTSVFHMRGTSGGGPGGPVGAPVKLINMQKLLLTMIEVASAMVYLHGMGVVHCDLKPANILLTFSNHDSRGFSAKARSIPRTSSPLTTPTTSRATRSPQMTASCRGQAAQHEGTAAM